MLLYMLQKLVPDLFVVFIRFINNNSVVLYKSSTSLVCSLIVIQVDSRIHSVFNLILEKFPEYNESPVCSYYAYLLVCLTRDLG